MSVRLLPLLVFSLVAAGCAATHPAPISSRSGEISSSTEGALRPVPADHHPAQEAKKTAPLETEPHVEWSWPLKRSLPAVFSPVAKGIDFTAKVGQPVLAAADGVVSYVGDNIKSYGEMVVIKHTPSYLSVYANLGKVLVKEGQTLKRGEKIAEMGDAANGKWHFEIRHQGKPVDPAALLPSNKP
ncbi:MAG: murein hydrolase activator EnvC family protein [Burkholderiales bacterium]